MGWRNDWDPARPGLLSGENLGDQSDQPAPFIGAGGSIGDGRAPGPVGRGIGFYMWDGHDDELARNYAPATGNDLGSGDKNPASTDHGASHFLGNVLEKAGGVRGVDTGY